MPATELVSCTSDLLDYVGSLKCRFTSYSSLLKDALLFFKWAVVRIPYDSSSNGDLESGGKGKAVHSAMWYSLIYIIRQVFPVDSFLFAIKSPQAWINNCVPKLARQKRSYSIVYGDSFVDLDAARFRHRLKSISYGQKHVPRLLPPISRHKPTLQMTGDQLSNYLYPPEPRGEDLRKWILVMETLFPNRSVYMRASKAQRAAAAPSKVSGPKSGVLAPSPRPRQPHTHLRYI